MLGRHGYALEWHELYGYFFNLLHGVSVESYTILHGLSKNEG